MRILAVRLLSTRPEPEAQKSVIRALDDPDEHVQRTALTALGTTHRVEAVDAIVSLLGKKRDWPVRVRAAEALGELGRGSRNPKAVQALSEASRSDPYALVREASLRALFEVDPAGARPVLAEAAEKDGEPRVRGLARTLSSAR